LVCLFFVQSLRPHRSLHSFPTRRSSDLLVVYADTLVHGRVEDHPITLGVLAQQLAAHGMSLVDELKLGLAMMVTCNPRLLRADRSEEHTSELQSLTNIVCRLLLEKKNPR